MPTLLVPQRADSSQNHRTVNLANSASGRTQMQNFVKTLSRPGIAAALFLLFSWATFVAGTSLPLAAHAGQADAESQALSLPEYGVTVQIPPGWGHHQYANVHELLNLPPEKIQKAAARDLENAATIHMGVLKLRTHSDAVERLSIVAAERRVQPTFLTIGGWPALQRQALVPKPERGEPDGAELSNEPRRMLVSVTTAIAVGSSVFRMDGTVAAESPAADAIAEQIKQIGRGLRFQQAGDPAQAAKELQKLQSTPSLRTIPLSSSSPKRIPASMSATLARTASGSPAEATSVATGLAINTTLALGGGGTEPEIAVSTDGKNIVIASQFSGVSSQDGGQTVSAPFNFPNTACGDSSLAFGRSGTFYEGSIGTTNTGCDSQVMDVSTDGGKTFQFRSNPFICNGTTNCSFNPAPDQEHIAADRFNAGPAPDAGDQVYVVWRGKGGYGITCSSDSGNANSWTAAAFNGDGSPDFPRVSVGQDGLVYVVYTNGDNIEVDRYTSCANGLTQQSKGGVIAASTAEVVCPVPGLDRCGGKNGFFRNDLRSPVVAVDDTNPSHIYASYATNTLTDASGNGVNENVVVADSFSHGDNGTWSTPTPINSLVNGRRYLPWLCSVGGVAYASWYDRRNATATTNDVADYFAGSIAPSGGVLTAAPDFQINAPGTGDPQCASGWPNAPDLASYSESCFVQPQLAGICTNGGSRCDFDETVCPNGGTCSTSNGQPKYGDYNGNACAAGRLYTVWGSDTAQPNTPPPGVISLFFSQKLVCCEPQIQVPGPVSMTACAGSTATATVNICNTGKADLQVNAISSSNSDITVATPTSGYPLIVSPDSCFPAQVTLTPGSATGAINGTLTISSNDTVTPSAKVQINGNSPAPSINAIVANGGSFGNVCANNQADLNLQLLNQGQCNLNITSIISSNPGAFVLPAGVTFPLVLSADANVNVPVRFEPSGVCSNTVPQSSNITIASNDPSRPSLVQSVSGIEGCPKLVLSPQNLTAAFAFPATVSDPTGTLGCYTDRQITVSNSGICPLNITNLVTTNGLDGIGAPLPATPLEFKVVNPTLPITIGPGAAPVPITVRFKPLILTDQNPFAPDQQTGSLSITSNDPVAGDNGAGLCGEPTYHSGARVLVVDSNSNPISSVAKITLQSKGLTPKISETLMPAPLLTGGTCGNTILFHLDNEKLKPAGTTGNSPLASYVLSAKNGSTQANMSFTLGQCQFQQIILQIK